MFSISTCKSMGADGESSLSAVQLLASENVELSPEEARFASMKPLPTLLFQSIGPLIYFVGNAIHDAIDLLLIAKALGSECLQIVGFSSMIRYLIRSFAVYFSTGAVARVSGLIGEHRKSQAEQVITDLFRLTVIVMLVVPVIFIFATKPMLKLMGCTDDLAEKGFKYLIPIMACSPFTGIYQMGCGFLQSEGRSIGNGILQLIAFVLNCGIFAPILLFGMKVSLNLAGLAFALSQLVPGVVLMIMIFNGKFNMKPTWDMWIARFCPETKTALKLAAPFVLNVIMGALPPMLLMNFIMKAATAIGVAGSVGNVFSVFLKIQTFTNSFSLSINQGFLAAGSFAHGARDTNRLMSLFIWSLGITFGILAIFTPIMVAKPDWTSSIWIDYGTEDMEWAIKMIRIPYYVNLLNAVNDAVTSFLGATKWAYTAMAPSLLRGVAFIVGSVALYSTNKVDPAHMMWSYVINDLVILGLDAAILVVPLMRAIAEMRSGREKIIDCA